MHVVAAGVGDVAVPTQLYIPVVDAGEVDAHVRWNHGSVSFVVEIHFDLVSTSLGV